MRSKVLGLVVALASFQAALAEEQPASITLRALSVDSAQKIAQAALAHCQKGGYQVAVAVVDRYGNLLAFLRDPLAGHHTIQVSQRKAYTAASTQSSTLALDLEPARFTQVFQVIGGGVAVRFGGYMYGAVGVSGAPRRQKEGDVDEECANAGIAAVQEALEFGG